MDCGYLALGDSYTIGEGVSPSERWPVQLVARLRAEGIAVEDPAIIATTGWTTDELAAGLRAAAPVGPFGLVTLLIGVNDQYRGRQVDQYALEFSRVLARAQFLAGGEGRRVVVLSIPDWGVTPFAADRDRAAIARAIDEFNAVAEQEVRRVGALWVDITDLSRARRADWETTDGLHPSGLQYGAWVERLVPVVRVLL